MKGKRKLRLSTLAKYLFLFILAAALSWIGFHYAMKLYEEQKYPANGLYVQVDDKQMNVYSKGEGPNTIVLLSGLGTVSPVLDFEPLVNEMSKYNRVVVVEPFGYGFSDQTNKERSVENIAGEIRNALKQLNIEGPYVLMPHSISGIYSLYYANEYPDEVKAVVGIDATLPAALAYFNESPPAMPGYMRYAAPSGLARIVVHLNPSAVLPIENEGAYSKGNLAMTKAVTAWNAYNNNVVNEANEVDNNVRKTAHLSFPSDLPVLFFYQEDERRTDEGKSQSAFLKTQLTDHSSSAMIPLKGHHYLHWTKYKEMSKALLEFLEEI
ncbi:alpha/beta fold hydrolase [Paenibacillus urinalis]|uniref:alpha/beta fold hydrolase n=1 Tax=Paenibacillus urinalis TaxID=521520 RepID=UPI003633EA40